MNREGAPKVYLASVPFRVLAEAAKGILLQNPVLFVEFLPGGLPEKQALLKERQVKGNANCPPKQISLSRTSRPLLLQFLK